MSNNKKPLISKLFSSNIALLILAFIISFVSWVVVSFVSDTNIKSLTISDVPVEFTIPENDNGYTFFIPKWLDSTIDEKDNNNTLKPMVSVDVKGNAIVIGSLSPENIKITGKLNQTDVETLTPQQYKVSLTYERTGVITNYEVESISPDSITVFVDRAEEKEFEIVNKISVETNEDTYVNTTLSQKTVKVRGPETLVDEIGSVEVHGELSEAKTITYDLIFYDKNEKEIDMTYLYPEFESVDVTSTVLPTKTVILKVGLKNAPSDNSTKPVITPSSVKIAGPQETLDSLAKSGLEIGTLDFADMENESITEKMTLTAPENCKIIPDSKGKTAPSSATVSMDLSSFSKKTLTANITYEDDGYYFQFIPSAVTVTICGPDDELNDIKASDLTIKPDFSNKLDDLTSGKTVSLQNIPLKISLSDSFTQSWITDSYSVEVQVTKK